jgi:hypothetical protein
MGLRKYELETLNTATFPPIPSPSVRTTTVLKPGDFTRMRYAERKSLESPVIYALSAMAEFVAIDLAHYAE